MFNYLTLNVLKRRLIPDAKKVDRPAVKIHGLEIRSSVQRLLMCIQQFCYWGVVDWLLGSSYLLIRLIRLISRIW